MPTAQQPHLFVVDGSNIATEGRSQPSLEQLNEAVLAFMDEHPDVEITVVVDATFGHRISKKETNAFDEAVANNELVTPPAGAIGRGDAFVLSIAHKANAGVLSNDSFQEFHGEYDWLFDEGRLIGGKPVPHVGWVFVARTPVRGPKSRQAVKEAKQADHTEAKQKANRRVRAKPADDEAADDSSDDSSSRSRPRSSTKTSSTASGESSKRSSGRGRRKRSDAPDDETTSSASASNTESTGASAPSKDHVNDLMPFLEFVENHPVGTSCTAQVESYASHGAYARTGDVLIYIPLRLMDDPAPRSARSALSIGDAVAVVIVGFTPDRRSIDAALPHMATEHAPSTSSAARSTEPADGASESPRRSAKKTAAKKTAAKKAPAKKAAAKKAPTKKVAAKKTAAKKVPTAKKTSAEKAPAKKVAAKKASAKRAPAKSAPAAEKAQAKKAPAKKAAAKKTAAKKAPAKKAAATSSSAKKAPAKKAAAKKTAAKKRSD